MLTALKIAVAAVLIVVAVVALGIFLVIRWFRRAVNEQAGAGATPPCRVNPEPEPNPEWRNRKQIEEWSAQLRALGFEDAGAYTIPEMAGLQMAGFCHPGERLMAVIYDHTRIAPSFDICFERPDTSGVTGANTMLGHDISRRPESKRISIENGTVEQLYRAVAGEGTAAERLAVVPANFASDFKASYARSMNWKLKQGGVTREDIRHEAKRMNQEITDEQLEECFTNIREGYVTELRTGCLAQYLDESRLPASEWEKVRDRMFAVPETLNLKEVVETIENTVCPDEEQRHRLEQIQSGRAEDALVVVDRILQDNVGTLNLKKLGEVNEPVRAYILLAP
jgi:hypothetical protein